MQRYHNNIQDAGGNAIKTPVKVWQHGVSPAALATIYSDNGVNEKNQPFNSSNLGEFDFYAANGRYDIELPDQNRWFYDVLLYDPDDDTSSGGEALKKRASSTADGTSESLQVDLPASITPSDATKLEFHFRSIVPEIDGDTLSITFILDDGTETGAIWSLEGWNKQNGSALAGGSLGPSGSRAVGAIGNASGESLCYHVELLSLNSTNAKHLRETVSYIRDNGNLFSIVSTGMINTTKSIKGARLDTDNPGDTITSGVGEAWAAISGGG